MRVVFASTRSSPGVTTAALAFASVWPTRVLLVEASDDGGAMAARFGLRLEPGLTTLAAAVRHDAAVDVLNRHVQPLPDTGGRLSVLVGPPTPESAQLALRSAGERLDKLLGEVAEGAVFVDAGRLSAAPAAAPLIAGADRVVLVARPRVEELQTLAHRLTSLRDAGMAPELLLVGRKPYSAGEIESTLGVAVLGVLADDRGAADAMAGVGTPGRLGRSALLRSAASLVDRLTIPAKAVPTVESVSPTTGTPAAWTARSEVSQARDVL